MVARKYTEIHRNFVGASTDLFAECPRGRNCTKLIQIKQIFLRAHRNTQRYTEILVGASTDLYAECPMGRNCTNLKQIEQTQDL